MVLKEATGRELVAAIKLVYEGRLYDTAGTSHPDCSRKREIAAALQLRDGTGKYYLTTLFKKLDVSQEPSAGDPGGKDLANKLSAIKLWAGGCAPLPPVLRFLGRHLAPAPYSSREHFSGPIFRP